MFKVVIITSSGCRSIKLCIIYVYKISKHTFKVFMMTTLKFVADIIPDRCRLLYIIVESYT